MHVLSLLTVNLCVVLASPMLFKYMHWSSSYK